MSRPNAYSAYLNNHYDGMDPNRLIEMLYDGALRFLGATRTGMETGNIQMRGENLGKAISVISELNASLRSDMHDEATEFLRGLYANLLTELPRVSISNDIEIVERAIRYITELRRIWSEEVMQVAKAAVPQGVKTSIRSPRPDSAPRPSQPKAPDAGYGGQVRNYGRSFAV